jgi:hypothetical protein
MSHSFFKKNYSGSKTADVQFGELKKVLDVLDPIWMKKILAVSTDGEATMHGIHSGLQTRIDNFVHTETDRHIIRVWCGLHQLDLAAQSGYERLCDGGFLGTLRPLIGHLRRQHNLKGRMNTTCPQVAATRWLSMSKVLNWLTDNYTIIRQHLSDNEVECAPSDSWWVIAFTVLVIANLLTSAFIKLQGKKTILEQQAVGSQVLAKDISKVFSIKSMSELPDETDEESIIVTATSNMYVDKSNVRSFILLDFTSLDMFLVMNADEQTAIIETIGEFALGLVERINNICAKRTTSNDPDRIQNFPVLPSQLYVCEPVPFMTLLLQQRPRLKAAGWSDERVKGISQGFKKFIADVNNSPDLKASCCHNNLTTKDSTVTDQDIMNAVMLEFDESWKFINGRYEDLQLFCAGLATTFANTATVESGFSIIGMEKHDQRASLTDFSLSSILQTKQYEILHKFSHLTIQDRACLLDDPSNINT